MRYFGGKQRVASALASVLNASCVDASAYVEPFVGSAAVMCRVHACKRIGGDLNGALIALWIALAEGWSPPTHVSESDYARVKAAANTEDPMTAFVGFGCSFAGKWFGGYARGGVGRNYAANAASSLRKKLAGLQGVEWRRSDYRALKHPSGSVIYCDPPYAGTTQY